MGERLNEVEYRAMLDDLYKKIHQEIQNTHTISEIIDALDRPDRFTEGYLEQMRQHPDFKNDADKIRSNIEHLGELNSWVTFPYDPKQGEKYKLSDPAGFLIPEQVRNHLEHITQSWIPGLRDTVRAVLISEFGGSLAQPLIRSLAGDPDATRMLEQTVVTKRINLPEAQFEYMPYVRGIALADSLEDVNKVLGMWLSAEASIQPEPRALPKIAQSKVFIDELIRWQHGEPCSAGKIKDTLRYISNSAIHGLKDKVVELLLVEIGGDKVASALHQVGGRTKETRLI